MNWLSTLFLLGASTFIISLGIVTIPAAMIAQESAFRDFLSDREIPHLKRYLQVFTQYFPATWKYGVLILATDLMICLAIPFWFAMPKAMAIISFVFILPLAALIFLVQLALPGTVVLNNQFNLKDSVLQTFFRLSEKPIQAIFLLVANSLWISIIYSIPTLIPFLGFSVVGLIANTLTLDSRKKEH